MDVGHKSRHLNYNGEIQTALKDLEEVIYVP